MAYDKPDGYNEVQERIVEFRAKHPEGTLRQKSIQFIEVPTSAVLAKDKKGQADHKKMLVVYTAQAFRTPDDPAPGEGTAAEFFPGKTPYTFDSEVQNAETAAWGRALIAVGAADAKKGLASAEEVRNRQTTPDEPAGPTINEALKRFKAAGGDKAVLEAQLQKKFEDLVPADAEKIIEAAVKLELKSE